ncbi:hypothetical protein ACFL6C_10270 [Myxococcota bacterium]
MAPLFLARFAPIPHRKLTGFLHAYAGLFAFIFFVRLQYGMFRADWFKGAGAFFLVATLPWVWFAARHWGASGRLAAVTYAVAFGLLALFGVVLATGAIEAILARNANIEFGTYFEDHEHSLYVVLPTVAAGLFSLIATWLAWDKKHFRMKRSAFRY